MGRFTSPDPLLNSGKPWDPQSWNRYSYVGNNPLRYTDPLGMYKWAVDCEETEGSQCKVDRDRFRQAHANLKSAAESLEKGSKERKELEKALKRIGEEGKGSTRIAFGDAGSRGNEPNLAQSDGRTITFNFNAIDAGAEGHGIRGAERGTFDASLLGHEGSHLGFRVPFLGIFTTRGEYEALFGQSSVYQGLKADGTRPVLLWNPSWAEADKATINLFRDRAIRDELERQNRLPK